MDTLLSAALALTTAARVITLDEALQTARAHQPQLRQAHPSTEAAAAVSDEARAAVAAGRADLVLLSRWLHQSLRSRGRARIRNVQAQVDFQRQQIRLQVEQVRLAAAAAKASQVGAREAQTSATPRLRLAEGRYQTGVGNIIELSDTQVALTAATTEVVSADFQLAIARAQLIQALGRGGS